MGISSIDRRSTWLGLLVAGAFFMENLDGTVITTAVPQMAGSFGVLPVDLDIGVSAYLLTLGAFVPASGWIADRFGARNVFAAAVAVFTIASALCAISRNLPEFVLVRVLQGVGGAMMVPVGRLVVLKNTPKDRLIKAIAILTWPALVAPILGPPVGGFITTYASWRWIFYLNLPLGMLALALAVTILPNDPEAEWRPFDWTGFGLSSIALVSLMYGLELVGRAVVNWAEAGGLLVAGAMLVAAAVRHFNRAAHPMIDLTSLEVRTFAVTIRGGSFFRMAISAVPFLLPLMFQVGFGLDAFHSGLLVIAVFAGNLLMKPFTTPILRRFGFKRVLVGNGILNVLSLLACAILSPSTPTAVVAAILFFGGLTRSMQFTAQNTIAFADIPEPKMSGANTLFSTAFQVTTGLGVALGAVAVRIGRVLPLSSEGDSFPAAEFRLAFVLVAMVALAGLFDAFRLDRTAGDHVAKRQAR